MTEIRVFDPAMCCSTGVCGPSVDPKLVRFAADLDWLKGQGVSVERFNLSLQPAAFAEDPIVVAALEAKGGHSLPLVKVNGEVKSSGVFPTRDELARWAGLADRSDVRTSDDCCGASSTTEEREMAGGCCGGATSSTTSRRGCCG